MTKEEKQKFSISLQNAYGIIANARIVNPDNLPYNLVELNTVANGLSEIAKYVSEFKIEEENPIDVPISQK